MRIRSLLFLGGIVLLVGWIGCAQQQEAAPNTEAASDAAAPSERAEPAGPFDVVTLVQDTRQRLRTARRVLRDNNHQAASLELSHVADQLGAHAAEASDTIKEDLQVAASELVEVAERLYRGPPVSRDDMDAMLTRTFWALAAYHQEQAAIQWTNSQARASASHLNAVATYINEAIGYKSAGIESVAEDLVRQIRAVVQRLEADGPPASENMGREIEEIGEEVQRLSQQVRAVIA